MVSLNSNSLSFRAPRPQRKVKKSGRNRITQILMACVFIPLGVHPNGELCGVRVPVREVSRKTTYLEDMDEGRHIFDLDCQ